MTYDIRTTYKSAHTDIPEAIPMPGHSVGQSPGIKHFIV